jgi:ornithine cyclodeaminase
MSSLEVICIDRLEPLLDKRQVICSVREALILQADGKVQSPLPGQLLFKRPHGDCHIKFGHADGSPTFTIKIATGFYENPKRGLPANHGLVLVWDAETGQPKVLLKDDGWLTAWRTAAATAIAAAALAPDPITAIGICGAGLQASLAAEWLPELVGAQTTIFWARDARKAEALAAEHRAAGRDARVATDVGGMLNAANIIVTATPSERALFAADQVRPGTHVVAIGADSPGKQEVPEALFSRARHIVTDDIAQAVDHGDIGCAVRAGILPVDRAVMLGHVLSGRTALARAANDITIADLTGIAAEDIAISGLFSRRLGL